MTFWSKAGTTANAAQLLLDAGHSDGAVNRAYYAMYFAARSTLEKIDPKSAAAIRHATLIGQFARQIVRGQGLAPEYGRMLNLAFDLRLIADYEPEGVQASDAKEIVADMGRFLAALAELNDGAAS